jgi:hypothetical protein
VVEDPQVVRVVSGQVRWLVLHNKRDPVTYYVPDVAKNTLEIVQ